MRDTLRESLQHLKKNKIRKNRMLAVLMVLSLVVSVDVFWVLRQPGLAMAGDATCGIQEHHHDENCLTQTCICESTEEQHIHEETCFAWETGCGLEEHSHEISCYSDDSADVETMLDWQEMFAGYPYTGNLRKDLVGIAQTQVGYSESELNFEVGADGVRRGYTRYGAWYGTPYRDWSAAFVSFCLNYAGADPAEHPVNIGAETMAEQWNRLSKFAPAGTYTPVPGDLVFFTDNTAGIVATVQNATIYVIRGDVDDAVMGSAISMEDPMISGWGVTEGTAPDRNIQYETPDEEGNTDITDIQNVDLSNGPVVVISAGSRAESEQPVMRFTLRTGEQDPVDPEEDGTEENTGGVIDLVTYLDKTGGSHTFILLDEENKEVPKNGDKNYIVQTGTKYMLTLSMNNPGGFLPGTYVYQLPGGLEVDGGTGELLLNKTEPVGSWTVTEDGLITLTFTEEIKTFTDLTISATMGIVFPEERDPIDFDGEITVTIEKPQKPLETTKLNKWAEQGKEGTANPDPSKLYWTIHITGKEGSQIPGSVLTDWLATGDYMQEHHYTESDIESGIFFGASETDPETGAELGWHQWMVYAGDPNLTWDDTGWVYNIPETVVCTLCGETELGNNGWRYFVKFTSTPDFIGTQGIFNYVNHVEVDDQVFDAWTEFSHGEPEAEIRKTGSFIGDADSGSFLWEFQVVIPGMKEGQKAEHFWYIVDDMLVTDRDKTVYRTVTNDANEATVTASYKGETLNVPNIIDATDADRFAWDNQWSTQTNGVYHGRALNLLCRCECTEENCPYWGDGKCTYEYWFDGGDGNKYKKNFCQCWTATEAVEFTFSYETEDLEIIEAYGSLDGVLHNGVTLYTLPSKDHLVTHGSAQASVPVPKLFEKKLTSDFNGYTAHYRITVNEAKLAITNGTPLIISDMMVDTLAFISGSLVITTEDADGNIETLQQGTDYTVTYDGTGKETDENGEPLHLLEIVIQRPQPVMYILDYDATLIIPEGASQVKYSNSATISLWGDHVTGGSEEKVYADINIAAKSYKVEMYKTCSLTGEPLGGATFGLYNEQGGLISTEVTDDNGELFFQTNIVEGIVFREHVLFYLQELNAPPGYQLDDTKYWFCFCNKSNEFCEKCEDVIEEVDAFRIPDKEIGKVHIANEKMSYNLPATGGTGIYTIVIVSVILIITSLIYGLYRRCKRERRNIG